jgi:molybdopterin-guanine dinucleotide biosynthesis protein MobB
MPVNSICHLLGFSAYSGTGKTTLLSQVLPVLKSKGVRVAVIKHAHHSFDVDHDGKDSHTLRHAGASQMLIASSKRWALMTETPNNSSDPSLTELIKKLDQSKLDIILVEGFKNESFTKIELHRSCLRKPLLYTQDKNIIAIASDKDIHPKPNIHQLDINNVQQITNYILRYIQYESNKINQIK